MIPALSGCVALWLYVIVREGKVLRLIVLDGQPRPEWWAGGVHRTQEVCETDFVAFLDSSADRGPLASPYLQRVCRSVRWVNRASFSQLPVLLRNRREPESISQIWWCEEKTARSVGLYMCGRDFPRRGSELLAYGIRACAEMHVHIAVWIIEIMPAVVNARSSSSQPRLSTSQCPSQTPASLQSLWVPVI